MASVKVKAGPSKGEEEAKEEEELRSILFDMKQSLAHGKKYDAPPRADIPALPMHEQEYEVRFVFVFLFSIFFVFLLFFRFGRWTFSWPSCVFLCVFVCLCVWFVVNVCCFVCVLLVLA